MLPSQTRILLIEDNPGDARLIRELLSEMNGRFHLQSADRLTSGLDWLATERFDLLLLDLGLPESQGLDTFLEAHGQAPEVPIVVLTGMDDEDLATRAVQSGAQDYLSKSQLDANLLVRAIRYAIERKRAAEALRRSEHYYRSLLHSMHEDILVVDSNYCITDVNHSQLNTSGLHREQILGRRCHDAFHGLKGPCDEFGEACLLPIVLRTGEPRHCQHRHLRADGSHVWVDVLLSPLRDELGQVTQVIAAIRDISELMEAKASLQRSEESYRTIFQIAPELILSVNREGTIVDCNHRIESVLGFTREEIIGRSVNRIFAAETAAEAWQDLLTTTPDGIIHNREYRVVRKDGTRIDASINYSPLHSDQLERSGTICTIEDITERKRAEKAKAEQLQFLQTLIDTIPNPVFYKDTRGVYQGCNTAFESFYHIEREQIVGCTVYDIAPRELADEYRRRDEEMFRNPGIQIYESSVRRGDDTVRDVIFNKGTFANLDGTTAGLVGVIVDITDRKQAEEGHARLATAVNQAAEAVVVTDTGGIIQFVNPAFEAITGYARADVIGRSMGMLLANESKETGGSLPDIAGLEEVWSGRVAGNRQDGALFQGVVTVSPVRDGSGRIINYVVVMRDVTQEVELEKQLRQAQKMEALGTLAGGIAHDFNNILGIIVGYTELAHMELAESSRIRQHLVHVRDAGKRASGLVKQILAFSRQSEQERQPVQFHLVLKEALKLLRASLPSTIEMQQNITSTSLVLADPTQVHQIIMNLCTNAHHAMREHGGTLTVTLTDEVLDEDFVAGDVDLHPGPYLLLSVGDTGRGIDPSIIDRIFNPYFTTKPAGEGTGLGLAVVHGIVRGSGGTIRVSSTLGKGTTFNVYLPRSDGGLAPQDAVGTALPTGTERVLLVDDEKPLAELGQRILTRLGYQVTALVSAVEALELFRSQPDNFDLVISDQTMPTLTGVDLAKAMLAVRPDLPIILCTGFSETLTAEIVTEAGIKELILKPLVIESIASTVRSVLDANRNR